MPKTMTPRAIAMRIAIKTLAVFSIESGVLLFMSVKRSKSL
jgi:hypothetical protein